MLKFLSPISLFRFKLRFLGSAPKSFNEMTQISETRLNMKRIFAAATNSVIPTKLVRNNLKINGTSLEVAGKQYKLNKNCYIIGFGKAVLGMAVELERLLGEHLVDGVLSVPVGIMDTMKHIPESLPIENTKLKIIEGAKSNLPDQMAHNAAKKIETLVRSLSTDSFLIVLISGGGSALLPAPISGITLEEKGLVIQLLNSAGANILELNCVRKKLSTLKGGGLVTITNANNILSLILSDVVGDDLNYIASGPTVYNSDAPDAAMKIIQAYNLFDKIPDSVKASLSQHEQIQDKTQFSKVYNLIIGSNSIALQFAKSEVVNDNYYPLIMSSKILNPVPEISEIYSSLSVNICKVLNGNMSMTKLTNFLTKVCSVIQTEQTFEEELVTGILKFNQNKGLYLLAGGETTVFIKGSGLGGRNQELALTFSFLMYKAMENNPELKKFNVMLLSAGTDGIDGPTTAAGAIGYSQIIDNATQQSINAENYLCNNDSYNFYSSLSHGVDLIVTGHTGTNVMDIHIITIEKIEG